MEQDRTLCRASVARVADRLREHYGSLGVGTTIRIVRAGDHYEDGGDHASVQVRDASPLGSISWLDLGEVCDCDQPYGGFREEER